jgi:branched-chain amino acid transport system substrate-binding protein
MKAVFNHQKNDASCTTTQSSGDLSMSRRQAVAGLISLAACAASRPAAAQPAVNKAPIILGQSVSLEGPLSDIGKPMHLGAKACFDWMNSNGGIQGRHIELIAKNDGYDVKQSLANIQGFLADKTTFGLFGCMGTPMVEALLPLIRNTDVPCFAPFTGATSVRPTDMRNVFHVRASFAEETEHLVQHLGIIGYRKIAIVYQGNAYGKEVVSSAQQALRANSLQAIAAVSVQNDASNASAAAKQLIELKPDVILIGLAGKPNIEFVNSIKSLDGGSSLPLYSVSAMGSPTVINALKDKAYGITVSQVMPSPSNEKRQVVREFLQAWRASKTSLAPSYPALEGYLYARIFAEILKKTGSSTLTRASFIEAGWGLKRYNMGGYEIGFDKPGRSASHFVELTMVGRDGNFVI